MDGIPDLDLWDVVIEVLHFSKDTLINQREITVAVKFEAQIPTPHWENMVTEMLMNCQMWITLSQAQKMFSIRGSVVHC